MPATCHGPGRSRNSRNESTAIQTGMVDWIRDPFSASVRATPTYSMVLKQLTPRTDSTRMTGQLAR